MTHHNVLETNRFPCGYPLSGPRHYPVLVHVVVMPDDLVDGHGDAELDESTVRIVFTRFLDQLGRLYQAYQLML